MRAPLLAVAVLSLALAACTSTPVAAPETPATTAVTPATPSTPEVAPKSVPAVQAMPAQLSVYFDYDVFTIKNEFMTMIEGHAAYLKAHPELEVKLEGNADERGGREYNLALGQKRSEAVKRALLTMSAGPKQLEAISYGKEKPKMLGHDETSWAENRRVDFVYATKK